MNSIDLNADLGEGGADDAALLELVDSANIACGGHAGSEEIMRRTVALAMAAGVAAGAHPGYEDRANFGRREMVMAPEAVTELVMRQVGKFAAITGGVVHHVKPHGALYHQAHREASLAAAVVKGIQKVAPDALLYALPDSLLAAAGRAAGMTVRAEGFADRRYRADGSLVPRGEPAAVISEVPEAVAQALELARSGRIATLCVHGDGPQALAMLRAIRAAFSARTEK
ncbi:MAG: 5-oxoprolinase subunit PxpA [Akkermansiaceae bacterium]